MVSSLGVVLVPYQEVEKEVHLFTEKLVDNFYARIYGGSSLLTLVSQQVLFEVFDGRLSLTSSKSVCRYTRTSH